MAARVSASDVRSIIDDNTSIDMAPFIATATVMVDYVNRCDEENVLSNAQLKEIEKWLAAHYYAHRDQQYMSKRTDKAEAEFQVGEKGKGSLDTTQWGRTAMSLDVTGCLNGVNFGRRKPSFTWLGKPVSEQIDYVDRN